MTTTRSTKPSTSPNHPTGRVIVTVAGSGIGGSAGDGEPAIQAQLGFPAGLAVDVAGSLYIADHANHRVCRVDADGVLVTVAGDGRRGYGGDGGPAASARLGFPAGVALDARGNLFVADEMNHRVRRVDPAGVITTVAGDGSRGEAGDGGAATAAQLSSPCSVAVDASGVLYVADAGNRRVRRVDDRGVITTVVTEPEPFLPTDVAVDADGNLFVADVAGRRVVRRDVRGTVSTISGPGDFEAPCAVAVDSAGTVHVADKNAHRVYRLTADGAELVAGCGDQGDDGDGGPATDAKLSYPYALAVGGEGGLFIADNLNHRVRKVPEQPVPGQAAWLTVHQEGTVEALPGQGGQYLNVLVSSRGPWSPGRVTHRFTAPGCLLFEPYAVCAYYGADQSVTEGGELDVQVLEDGRLLQVTGAPQLNTDEQGAAAVLAYTLGVTVRHDAEPGRYTDGWAEIAGQPGVRLKGTVLEPGSEPAG